MEQNIRTKVVGISEGAVEQCLVIIDRAREAAIAQQDFPLAADLVWVKECFAFNRTCRGVIERDNQRRRDAQLASDLTITGSKSRKISVEAKAKSSAERGHKWHIRLPDMHHWCEWYSVGDGQKKRIPKRPKPKKRR